MGRGGSPCWKCMDREERRVRPKAKARYHCQKQEDGCWARKKQVSTQKTICSCKDGPGVEMGPSRKMQALKLRVQPCAGWGLQAGSAGSDPPSMCVCFGHKLFLKSQKSTQIPRPLLETQRRRPRWGHDATRTRGWGRAARRPRGGQEQATTLPAATPSSCLPCFHPAAGGLPGSVAEVPGTAGRNKTLLHVRGSRAGASGSPGGSVCSGAPRKCRPGRSLGRPGQRPPPPPWGRSVLAGQRRPPRDPGQKCPPPRALGPEAAKPLRLSNASWLLRPPTPAPQTHTLERLGSWRALTWLRCFGGL